MSPNGETPLPESELCSLQEKTPKGKGAKSPKTPPKAPLPLPELKAKLMEAVNKVGVPSRLFLISQQLYF